MNKKFKSFNGLVYSTNPEAIPTNQSEPIDTPTSSVQSLKVSLDKKQRKGKIVTLIEGFIGSDKDLNELGKKLKSKCGTGGSVKANLIIIQGDFKLKIIDWLKELGYNVK